MTTPVLSYRGYRYPPEIISHAVRLYHRFCLSFRDVEDLLAERGVTVSHEAIRQWCQTFGLDYARRLRRNRGRLGDTWYLDELFVTIQGRRQDLWRAKIETWRVDYNQLRPHGSLGHLTPNEYANQRQEKDSAVASFQNRYSNSGLQPS